MLETDLSTSPFLATYGGSFQVVTVLNSVLALLAKNSSGHTAAALLDQWRAITLGGVWAGGDAIGLGTETEALGENSAEDVPSIARYSIPTEVSVS